jgi:nascent polypeptide-associated complex subunit alpha
MFPGGRGMNPKQMKAMMKRMGIDQKELQGVEEVIVRMRDKEIFFRSPDVTSITAQGQVTYQVVGKPEERPLSATADVGTAPAEGGAVDAAPTTAYSEEDVALVMAQTGSSEGDVRAALDECEGEVAEAIMKLIS